MARATAAPPVTASEPPSQKSFCTSTMISARIGPPYPEGPCGPCGPAPCAPSPCGPAPCRVLPAAPRIPLLADVGGGALGDADEFGVGGGEHAVRMAGR